MFITYVLSLNRKSFSNSSEDCLFAIGVYAKFAYVTGLNTTKLHTVLATAVSEQQQACVYY